MYQIRHIAIELLKPHEEIKESHVQTLIKDIQKDNHINTPILIDKENFIILDGHHRYNAAKILKLAKLPCICIDYTNDTIVSVEPRRESIPVSKEKVIQAGLSGKLFPNKTTKHTLLFNPSYTPTPLPILQNV